MYRKQTGFMTSQTKEHVSEFFEALCTHFCTTVIIYLSVDLNPKGNEKEALSFTDETC